MSNLQVSYLKIPMFIFLIIALCFSCSDEDLFEETIAQSIEENNPDPTPEDPLLPSSGEPCDFDLASLNASSSITLDCTIDLNGSTVDLPENINLEYNGGEIINGTLNFSGGKIDGRLLNISLTIEGSVTLIDPNFIFMKEKWGVVEGKVTDEVALNNSFIINDVIAMTKSMGATTFKIDKLDAYFGMQDVVVRKFHGIFIPSDFSFIMTENTNLRVQPNGLTNYALLFSWEVDNVLISGGKLWGDRYDHDYTSNNGVHDWGMLISFKAVHNGVVDNVEMHEAMADGFYVWSSSDRNLDGTLKPDRRESFNVTLKNSLIANSRRNNISIVDGTNIFIEYNTIIKAGSGDGTAPAVGIDVESRRQEAADGNSTYFLEKTDNIHIRHNIFEDNFNSDISLLTGENNHIYENTFRSKRGVSTGTSSKNIIYNNIFEGPTGEVNSYGIDIRAKYWANGEDRVFDYEVTGNSFTNYHYGIKVAGLNHQIKNNSITNCERSVLIGTSTDLVVDNNVISSNRSNSYGYYTIQSEYYLKNCLITNGVVNVQDKALFFTRKNNIEQGLIIIDNVEFNGDIVLNDVEDLTLQNSTYNNIEITDCNPTLINNNNP